MTRQRAAYVDLTSMTPDEAQGAMKAATNKGHKYGARKTEYGGQMYDSKAEADYAAELDRLLVVGYIKAWQRGYDIPVLDAKERRDRIMYRPDFYVIPCEGAPYYVDVKGVETPVFRLKCKLWRAMYPDTPLLIVGKHGERWLTDPPAGSSLVQGAGE